MVGDEDGAAYGVGIEGGQGDPAQLDRAALRVELAAEAQQQVGGGRRVGADDADQAALRDVQVDVAQRPYETPRNRSPPVNGSGGVAVPAGTACEESSTSPIRAAEARPCANSALT